jgi:hypothetical protein
VEVCTPRTSIEVGTAKRNGKLRAKLAAAPAGECAAIEAKLQRTYSLVPGTKPST